MNEYKTNIDKDLLNHGAVSSGPTMSTGEVRDLPNFGQDIGGVDLSDHGAVSSSPAMFTGEVRDLPNFGQDIGGVDLSDHGAVSYASKEDTWGTDDIDLIHEMDVIEHAAWSENVERVIPQLPADSLKQILDMRYRHTANILQDGKYNISSDDKLAISQDMSMSLRIIDSAIATNPHSLEEIFEPELFLSGSKKTDVFGVLAKYKEDLDELGVPIPMINGKTGENIVDENGKVVTVEERLEFLLSKNPKLKQQEAVETKEAINEVTKPPVVEEVAPVVETPIVEQISPVVETPIVEQTTPVVEQSPVEQVQTVSFWNKFKEKHLQKKNKNQEESIDASSKLI